jgi:hypothetical protein
MLSIKIPSKSSLHALSTLSRIIFEATGLLGHVRLLPLLYGRSLPLKSLHHGSLSLNSAVTRLNPCM